MRFYFQGFQGYGWYPVFQIPKPPYVRIDHVFGQHSRGSHNHILPNATTIELYSSEIDLKLLQMICELMQSTSVVSVAARVVINPSFYTSKLARFTIWTNTRYLQRYSSVNRTSWVQQQSA